MSDRLWDLCITLRRETVAIYGHPDPGAIQDVWDEIFDILLGNAPRHE